MDAMLSSNIAAPAYDRTGKLSLDHIYNCADPREYFSTLRKLDYCVPGLAKPVFRRLLDARREMTGETDAKIVDVGCSYGINAALLKHDMSMEDLYRLYDSAAPEDAGTLLERDRALFTEAADEHLSVVGVDAAERAVAYAVEVGILDAGVTTNLETDQPSRADRRAVEDVDMIISTGCVGYVTETSLEQLVDAGRDRDAWMANFVLRMFDYEPVEEMMAGRGYETEKLEGALFAQRRFISREEQEHVFDNLERRGLTPEPAELEGWYLAELHVSRPAGHAAAPLKSILAH